MKNNRRKILAAALCFVLLVCSFVPALGEKIPERVNPWLHNETQTNEDTASLQEEGVSDAAADTGELVVPAEAEEPDGEPAPEVPPRTIHISTPEEFASLAEMCVTDKASENLTVLLDADLDIGSLSSSQIPVFNGVFLGQGHRINSFFVKEDGAHIGLFRYLTENAIVRDIYVNGRITCENNGTEVGGIAGKNEGLITGCVFEGNIAAQENTGGIAGENCGGGVIANCTFKGRVQGPSSTGGIAGLNEGSILSCKNAGKVNTELKDLNESVPTTLSEAISGFDIATVSEDKFVDIMNVGGIAGRSEGLIDGCVNEGTIGYALTGYNVGGIAGITTGYISFCRNEGEVYGKKDTGGIAGQVEPYTFWEYTEGQLDDLLEELRELDKRLSDLVSNAAFGVGKVRQHLNAAECAASISVSKLRSLIGETEDEVLAQAGRLREIIDLLTDAVNKEDAEAIAGCLDQLKETLEETDFFSQPVTISMSGKLNTDTVGELNTRSDTIRNIVLSFERWLKLMFAWAEELSLAISEGRVPAMELPGQAGTVYDVFTEFIPDLPEMTEDGIPAENGTDDSEEAPEGPSEDVTIPEDVPDSFYIEEDAGADPDEYIIIEEPVIEEDYPAEEAGQAYEEPEEIPADPENVGFTVYEYIPETVGSREEVPGPEDTTAFADPADAPAAETEPSEDGADDAGAGEAPSSTEIDFNGYEDIENGIGIEDIISVDMDSSTQIDISGKLDHELDGDLKIELDAGDFPSLDEVTGILGDLLAHCGNILDTDTLAEAKEILADLSFTKPDAQPFYASVRHLINSMRPLGNDLSMIASGASDDFNKVTEQMDTIFETFFDMIDDLSLTDTEVQSDVSLLGPWTSTDSVVTCCLNAGAISGETNVGGIIGAISFEDLFDAEDLLDVSQYLLKDARKLVFSAVRECANSGTVAARKTAAGGITGSAQFGVITRCLSSGEILVEEGDYCGGIAGTAEAAITECQSKNFINGNRYSGGIAGKGAAVLSSVSYGHVDGLGGYMGAIAGWADGEISENYYYDRGLGGIDGVSFIGYTDPFTDEELPESAFEEAVLMLEKDVAAKIEGSTGFPGSAEQIEEIEAAEKEAEAAEAETEETEAAEAETEEAAAEEEKTEAEEEKTEAEEEKAEAEEEKPEAEEEKTEAEEEKTEAEEEKAEAEAEEEKTEAEEEKAEAEAEEEKTEAEEEKAEAEEEKTEAEEEKTEAEEEKTEAEEEKTEAEEEKAEAEEVSEETSEAEKVPEEASETEEVSEEVSESAASSEPELTGEAPAEAPAEPDTETVVFADAGAPEDMLPQENEAGGADEDQAEGADGNYPEDHADKSRYAGDPVVTFVLDDGTIVDEVVVPFGEGITYLPEVENNGDDYWVWDEFNSDAIYSNTTVTGSYHRPLTTLADGNPPRFLVEGIFYDGNELKVSEEDIISEDPDEKPDKAYTLNVTDYDEPLKVRMKADYEGTLYRLKDNGDSEELAFTKDGSYLVFDLENGGTVYYQEKLLDIEEIHKMPLWQKIAIGAGAFVILLIMILLIRRRRKKRKLKKLMEVKEEE